MITHPVVKLDDLFKAELRLLQRPEPVNKFYLAKIS
jgi:hypothetical protein